MYIYIYTYMPKYVFSCVFTNLQFHRFFDPSNFLVLRCQQVCFLLATSQEPRGYRVEMVHGSARSETVQHVATSCVILFL